MEKQYTTENNDTMFDFKKTNTVINDNMKKVEFSGYKKLVFVSLALAAFLSIGMTAGNMALSKYQTSLEIDKVQTLSQLQQQKINSEKLLENQQQLKEKNILLEQKQLDFLMTKIKGIDKTNFSQFITYLENHQNLYDERLKNIRKSLFEAQSADRERAVDPNTKSKELEIAIVNYKKDLEDAIQKTTSIYSSVKDNTIKEDKVNINDMKTFLKLYDQFSLGLVFHNKPIELKIKDILYIKNKANVDYNISHDMFSIDEKINQEVEKNIKKLKM